MILIYIFLYLDMKYMLSVLSWGAILLRCLAIGSMKFDSKLSIAQNAIVFRDMYLQCPARNNNG